MANPVSAIIDPTPWIGTGAAGFGFAAAFSQFSPVVTFVLALIVSTLTIAYLRRRLKNGKLDEINTLLDIEIKKKQLKRRASDHDPVED